METAPFFLDNNLLQIALLLVYYFAQSPIFPYRMGFKDHYKTLRISPKASLEEIKKAYRVLAHQYHPDKNETSAADAALFLQINEAYKVLSNSRQRAAYDQERWLNGKSQVSDSTIISPQWMQDRIDALAIYIGRTGTTRIRQEPLADYLYALLSEEHITIILKEATTEQKIRISETLYPVIALLDHRFVERIITKLFTILPQKDSTHAQQLASLAKEKKRAATWEQYKPFVILGIAVLLVILMMALQ